MNEWRDLPKISIGIPTYNQYELLVQAVESALSQKYNNIEVIVSDDSQNNLTKEALLRFSSFPNFKYFKSEMPLGRVANYRKILYEYSDLDWHINLDGDDYSFDYGFIKECITHISDCDPKQNLIFI